MQYQTDWVNARGQNKTIRQTEDSVEQAVDFVTESTNTFHEALNFFRRNGGN